MIPHHDGEQDWLVGFRLQPTGGHRGELRPVEFALRQVDQSASSAMTSKTIRSLPIGELLAAARQAASPQRRPARKSRLTSPSDIYLAPFLEDSRGRPPRGDAAYANLALVYAGLVESGDRAPAKTIAARHGGAGGTWANRIAEARRRGFLTPVKSGGSRRRAHRRGHGNSSGSAATMSERPLGLGEHGEIEATPQIKDAAGKWKRAPKPRGAQRWRARCYFRGYDGVIGEVSRVGRTRRLAVEAVEEALAERDRGNADMTSSMKLVAAGELWLAQISRTDSGLSARTVLDPGTSTPRRRASVA